jgi:hypothetical protein
MADWNKTSYPPMKSWDEIKRENADREFDRRYPTKWWEPAFFAVVYGGALLALAGCALWLLGWVLSAPFAS